ncbi:hypothetical protein [Spirosoma sordidisoli]|uniref:Uncharacterized protein n=1 Tax=Spirosoma sordidisoli TaxID=2502893 RepID=A0A4V1RWL5_9BACT|nr:hypothetical protein [Spirosoma sordidisoli]RYC70688.1 hypothetical protein EQG79_00620 [Spirosoma sordidisoli]
MKKRLFQIAILFHPSAKDVEAGKQTEIILDPKNVLATNEDHAKTLASREIPEKYLDKLEQVEVVIRPF